jgi:hypothetical protein
VFTWLWKRFAMNPPTLVLSTAQTRFNDYVGTVAADDAIAVKNQPSLYELANIDRDRYTILAVDLRIDDSVNATVYAIDRVEQGIGRTHEIAALMQTRGEIPVVPFDIPPPNVEAVLTRGFKRISVRLVTRHLHDYVLVTKPDTAENVEA